MSPRAGLWMDGTATFVGSSCGRESNTMTTGISRRDLADAALKKYAKPIHAYIAGRVDNPHDVEDISQSMLLKLLRSNADELAIENPLAFLLKVTKRAIADFHSRRARDLTYIEWVDGMEQLMDRADVAHNERYRSEDVAEHQQHLDQLRRVQIALARLPLKLYRPFILNAQEGKTYAEVAAYCDISEAAAKKRIYRARKRVTKYCYSGENR